MHASTSLNPNPVLEKLRSDQERMEHLTKSYLAGLEHLGEENNLLAGQIAEQDGKIASLMEETKVYHKASTEAQGKLEGSLQVSNQLRVELERYQNVNTELKQQLDEARGAVLELQRQLDAAQDEVRHSKTQVEGLDKLSQLPISSETPGTFRMAYTDTTPAPSDHSRLWPFGTAKEAPTPPLAPPDVFEHPRTHQRGHAVPIRPRETSNQDYTQIASPGYGAAFSDPADLCHPEAVAGPLANHTATSKPKTTGIPRGVSHIDDSFARIKNNLARQSPPICSVVCPVQMSVVASKTNGSKSVRASPAPNETHVSPSPRDFSLAHATFVQDGKKTLNPECVPFAPPTAKGRSVSKLNPLSQDFIPAISQPKRSVTPPHKRALKGHGRSENITSDNSTGAATFESTSRPVSFKTDATHHESKSVPTPTPANPDSTTATVNSSSRSQLDSADSSTTEDGSCRVTDEGIKAKTAKPIPPHLRHLPRTSVATKVVPAATLITPSTQVTADALSEVTNIIPPETATMKAWLDELEKPSMGQSALDERSKPTSASPSSDKLIDLAAEDVGISSITESVPGFKLDAMEDLLDKSKAASPTISSDNQTLSSLLARVQSLPAKAEDKSDLAASLQGLLAECQNRRNPPNNLQKSQGTLEDEGYLTASPEDPYLTQLSRGLSSRSEASTGPAAISQREVGTGASGNRLAGADVRDERLPEFKANLSGPKTEDHITADFLTAYNSKLLGVQSKYGTSAGPQAEGPALYHKDQYLDPDYVAPKIVGTRRLGELLDPSLKRMILSETPGSRSQDMKVGLEWKPVVKDGKTVFVL